MDPVTNSLVLQIERLKDMLASQSQQLALAQYRIALLENQPEDVAYRQMITFLLVAVATQANQDPNDEMQTYAEDMADRLIASLERMNFPN